MTEGKESALLWNNLDSGMQITVSISALKRLLTLLNVSRFFL
jgi:hypothetical protein